VKDKAGGLRSDEGAILKHSATELSVYDIARRVREYPQLLDCALIWTAPPSRGSLFLEWVAALLLGIVDSYASGPKAPPRIRQIIEPVEGGAVQKGTSCSS